MCKYVISREDLGSRITGYNLYESNSKEIIGMTEKAIVNLFKSGGVVHGFRVVDDKLEDMMLTEAHG